MGKIFPQIKRLSEKPSCFEATVQLIEKSFHYKAPFTFKTDFAPLIDESNHANCFIIVNENDEVLAHIGAKDKKITLGGVEFPITLLGGIAVDEKYRGEGHFQTLMQEVLSEKRSDTTLFLLWGDLEKLYNKFGFYLCGTQFEVEGKTNPANWIKTKYHELSREDKGEVESLYSKSFAHEYLTLQRGPNDWDLIAKITSADLYIKRDANHIQSYFFTNKGQDLPGIIYEYGTTKDFKALLEEIKGMGKVWMCAPLLETEALQFQFMLSPGDQKLFREFVLKFTQNEIDIKNINLMKQEVFFDFKEETLVLNTQEFLRGIFGPGSFEEIEMPSLFLSGLDSI